MRNCYGRANNITLNNAEPDTDCRNTDHVAEHVAVNVTYYDANVRGADRCAVGRAYRTCVLRRFTWLRCDEERGMSLRRWAQ
eukprot:gene10381-biopygen428